MLAGSTNENAPATRQRPGAWHKGMSPMPHKDNQVRQRQLPEPREEGMSLMAKKTPQYKMLLLNGRPTGVSERGGKWYVRKTLPDKSRPWQPLPANRCGTLTDAKSWADTFYGKDKHDSIPAKQIRFEVAAAETLAKKKMDVATRKTHESLLRTRILPAFAGYLLVEITVADVRDKLLAPMLEEELSEGHMANACQVFSNVFRYARNYMGSKVPSPYNDLPKEEKPQRNGYRWRRILTTDELERALAAVPEYKKKKAHNLKVEHYQALIAIGGWGGLRFSEALGLRRRDIDFDAGVIRIRGQLDGTAKIFVEPKNRWSKGRVDIADDLEPYLRAVMLASWTPEVTPDSFVFSTQHGTGMNRTNVAPTMKNIFHFAGLDVPGENSEQPHRVPTFHELRHMYASMLLAHADALGGLMAVAKALRHRDVNMLLTVYGHEWEELKQAGTVAGVINQINEENRRSKT